MMIKNFKVRQGYLNNQGNVWYKIYDCTGVCVAYIEKGDGIAWKFVIGEYENGFNSCIVKEEIKVVLAARLDNVILYVLGLWEQLNFGDYDKLRKRVEMYLI